MYDAAKVKTLLDQRKPGHALPQAFYRDPAFYEFDLDAIFGRVWLFAGLDLDDPLKSAGTLNRIQDEIGKQRTRRARHRGVLLHARVDPGVELSL